MATKLVLTILPHVQTSTRLVQSLKNKILYFALCDILQKIWSHKIVIFLCIYFCLFCGYLCIRREKKNWWCDENFCKTVIGNQIMVWLPDRVPQSIYYTSLVIKCLLCMKQKQLQFSNSGSHLVKKRLASLKTLVGPTCKNLVLYPLAAISSTDYP